ncbi:MAG: hypothetical protein A2452_02785 [Candidatus Firestonebacteria bacterium RIFOXYC2_FULL_39_67]|nr:MAG: hypothetical protein A2536_02200 [Candidatus Firestonebacteria bacterium RIFOXYD2_FULL_39_29]OGF53062.1 MAG: hypothetical protein A2497_03975 [Candidatus Firestonebacteria bacterium RifOxyC12_full_39_7]OGF55385.1 MAG: hypothetical protein A2452_02785 [Candidatus Firestonebacteria bacterium RIFOXYC2_FULL_39_67]
MSNIATYVLGNFFDKITMPKNIKTGLITALTVTVISQLLIFYVFVAARVNPADSYIEAFTALFNCSDCGIIALWEMLITAIGLLLLHFKVLVFILSILVLAGGIFIIKIIPDEWYEVGDLFALLLIIGAQAGIIGLALFEILPYVIGNYN